MSHDVEALTLPRHHYSASSDRAVTTNVRQHLNTLLSQSIAPLMYARMK